MGIALIGFMGSGKSTIGKALSQELGLKFYDTDELIVKHYGNIAEIFAQYGEEYFRDIETETLKKVIYKTDIILGTGGGIVIRPQNMNYIKKKLKIVWLKTRFDDIINRLNNDSKRPLWNKDREQMYELFKYREKLYEQYADIIVENTNFTKTISVVKEYVKGISSA